MLTKVKSKLATDLAAITDLKSEDILKQLETPKLLDHGHLSFPVFSLAKVWRKAPPSIAAELAEKLTEAGHPEIAKVQPVGGFLNIHFKESYFQGILMSSSGVPQESFGHSDTFKGKTMVIDYSSPNVAKPMGIGHLRSTVIGQALYNMSKTQGYKAIGVNHIGDWGVQFGKLAWSFDKWGEEYDFEKDPFSSLYAIYVRFHKEAEERPEMNDEGSLLFRKLEQGDKELEKLWKWFIEISLKEYNEVYKLMNVSHDEVLGESFYNDKMPAAEKKLEELGLLEESEGAMVVRLDEENMPPCLIRKSDGASLYATRDIACAIYRHEVQKGDLLLYETGSEQTLHFRQIYKVLEKMGYEWAKDCHHVSHGMYKFKEGKMSTRKGNLIFLRDVVDRSIEIVKETINQKNPDLENKDYVAQQVGVGAIIFNDLINDRVKNVEFSWESVLDFEGDSGPYVQYAAVRCQSLMRKYDSEIAKEFKVVLDSKEERALVRLLMNFQETLSVSFKHFKPHLLANYLLDVCKAFNHFYHKRKILGIADKELESSRMSLVLMTNKVLSKGLAVLNIETPEAM